MKIFPRAKKKLFIIKRGDHSLSKKNNLNKNKVPPTFKNLSEFDLVTTSKLTGISKESIKKIAIDFAKSKSALAIGGGISDAGQDGYVTIVAINLLNYITGNLDKVDFDNYMMLSNASTYADMVEFKNRADSGQVDILIVHNANPLYALPDSLNIEKTFEKILNSFYLN